MKKITLTLLMAAFLLPAMAQQDSVKTDSVKTVKKKKIMITGSADGMDVGIVKERDTTVSKAPGFSFGVTFSRFDLGFSRPIDNGSFTLQPQNKFLDYRGWKTINVGFDLLQMGYRFNSAFKIYLAAGFDWTHIRLRDNITIQKSTPLSSVQDDVDFSKNRF